MTRNNAKIGGAHNTNPDSQARDVIYVVTPAGTDQTEWQGLVEEISRVLSLHPHNIDIASDIRKPLHQRLIHGVSSDDMLDAISRLTGLVLILPRRGSAVSGRQLQSRESVDRLSGRIVELGAESVDDQEQGKRSNPPSRTNLDAHDTANHQLKRVVIPIDNTDTMSSKAIIIVNQFHGAGIATLLLHVIDSYTRPRIWEGVGHYIEAWREELSAHHHGIPYSTILDTAVGETALQVKQRLSAGDLLVILWNRDIGHNRAIILRQLLSDADIDNPVLDTPVLLYPLR